MTRPCLTENKYMYDSAKQTVSWCHPCKMQCKSDNHISDKTSKPYVFFEGILRINTCSLTLKTLPYNTRLF